MLAQKNIINSEYKPSGKYNLKKCLIALTVISILFSIFGCILFYLKTHNLKFDQWATSILTLFPLLLFQFNIEKIHCRNYLITICISLSAILFYYGAFIFLSYICNNNINEILNLNNFKKYIDSVFVLINPNIKHNHFAAFLYWLFDASLLVFGICTIATLRVSTPYDEINECWLKENEIFFSPGTEINIYQAIQKKNYAYIKTLTPIKVFITEGNKDFVRVKIFSNQEKSKLAYIQIAVRVSKHWWGLTKVKYKTNQIPIEIAEAFLYTKELKTPNNSI